MDLNELRRAYAGHIPGLMGARGGSAVLVPLVTHQGQTCLLYEVRSANVRQPGEVCFPGGKMETGETPVACALRETWEELGIPERAVEVIGEMDFLFIRANCLLRPVLGIVDPAAVAAARPEPSEVAETFLLPVQWLREHPPEVYVRQQPVEAPDFPYRDAGADPAYPWRPYRLEVPVYHGTPYPLWGLTARITMEVISKLES